MIAIPMTIGTKIPATLSAILLILAFVPDAVSTILIIWFNVVSSPTLMALHFKTPFLLIVALLTKSPIFLSTGMLSPVKALSSTLEIPSIISPSTGTDSPGLTINISPITISSKFTSNSSLFLMTHAVFGAKFNKLLIAFVVLPFE